MKVTNAEIFNTKESMQKLLRVKMPVLVSMELVKMVRVLSPLHADIEQVRNGLIEHYGEKNEARPGDAKISPDMAGFPKFAEEFGQLMEKEVEVDINVVKIPSTIEIEPYVLLALEKFVEVDGRVEVEPKK